MEKVKKNSSIKKILALTLAFMMVFTGLASANGGLEDAWAAVVGDSEISVSTEYLSKLSFGTQNVGASNYRPFELRCAKEDSENEKEYDFVLTIEEGSNQVSATTFLSSSAPAGSKVRIDYKMCKSATVSIPMNYEKIPPENGYIGSMMKLVFGLNPSDFTVSVKDENGNVLESKRILVLVRPILDASNGITISYADSNKDNIPIAVNEAITVGRWNYTCFVPAGVEKITLTGKAKTTASKVCIGDKEAVSTLSQEFELSESYRSMTSEIKISNSSTVETGNYSLNIIEQPKNLSITKEPDKTAYVSGESFDPEGMVVKAVYADGSEEKVADYTITSGDGVLQADRREIELTYKGLTAVLPITVVTPFEGSGTEDDPYKINMQEDLIKLSAAVKGGVSFEGKYFMMTGDIELPQDWQPVGYFDESYRPPSSTLDMSGGMKPFGGTFDGGNYTLTVPKGGLPLFGCVRNATVKNLNIYGEQIEGYGLVNNYVVDYGRDGNYDTVVEKTVSIDHVTIKSGTKVLQSGFIGGYASGKNTVYITNCKIEKDVVIGYDKSKSNIGSFAGDLNGIITNSTSEAVVYGVDQVGGLAGRKGQSMGYCNIQNSSFAGTVEGSGEWVGGIIGQGYDGLGSAPNTMCVVINNCFMKGSVIGDNYVGGIFGGEPDCKQNWGKASITDNYFVGTVTATESEGKKGGVIGYMTSLNKNNLIQNNYYVSETTEKGIGGAKYIDTSAKAHGWTSNSETYYMNTTTDDLKVIEQEINPDNQYSWITKKKLNRDDDPLGKDAASLAKKVGYADFTGEKALIMMNGSNTSFKNWVVGEDGYPIQGTAPVAYKLEISGNYKDQYFIGEDLNLDGMILTVTYSDGMKKTMGWKEEGVEITGYTGNENDTVRGVQTLTITYGMASTEIAVDVLNRPTSENETITVSFMLLGDIEHNSDQDTIKHTLSAGNLETWIPRKQYTLPANSTAADLFKKALAEHGFQWEGTENNQFHTLYISGIRKPNSFNYLSEFTNGPLSGWMYTINGVHPEVGISARFLNDGDNMIFHYTDDYTKEEGSEKWNTDVNGGAAKVTTTGTSGSATTTTPTEVTVSGSTATATVKSENAAEAIKQAQENKSAEIVLNVAASDTKGAETVKVQLDTATVKSVVADTDASLTIKTENGQVSLDREALTTIASEAKGTTITLEVVKVDKPTETQKKAAGTNGFVIRLVIKSGDKIISDFNKGKATVTVEIPANLQDKKVAAIYIAEDGQIEQLSGKTVKIDGKDYYTFETPHFSAFALVDADELGLEVTDEEQAKLEKLIAGVENTTLKASSKKVSNGIKIAWTKSKGYKVDYYEVFRSTKRYSDYGKAAFYTTKNAENPAKTWYVNTKDLKGGIRYYYKVRGVRILDDKKYYTQWSTKAWRIA